MEPIASRSRRKRYLDRSSPAWIGGSIEFFAAPEMVRLVLDDPVSYVRHGGSAGLAHLAPDHPDLAPLRQGR